MPWTTDAYTGRPSAGRATSVPTQARAKTEGGGNKLFVGCLPYSKTEADLEPVFGQFGIIEEVACLKDASGGSKGAAFVTFQDETSASTAMSYLQGHVLEGATRGMNISFATSGGPRNGGGHNGNGNGAWRSMPQGGRGYAPPPPPGPPPAGSYKGGTSGGVSPPGSKVFVGQLPFSRTEADLMQLFSSVGPVVEVCLLKDKKTQEKKGAAFVRYQTAQHAAAAASSLNGFLFSGSTRPITVSIAQSDVGVGTASLGTVAGGNQLALKRSGWQGQQGWGKGGPDPSIQSEPGAKLFVGQLPFSRNEEDLRQLFGQYGPVVEVLLHRDSEGQKKGGAFVRYQSASNAAAALDLDGYMFQGSTRPITVAIAGETGAKRRRMS